MCNKLDFRIGKVNNIQCFSKKKTSPRRKFCKIDVYFEELDESRQSIGQFYHHIEDIIDKKVLCIINLPSKSMFGQQSDVLILGLPHVLGGIIKDDDKECQATYITSLDDETNKINSNINVIVPYEYWEKCDLKAGNVIEHDNNILIVDSDGKRVEVNYRREIDINLVDKVIVYCSDSEDQNKGMLPLSIDGNEILAGPENRNHRGTKIY